MEGLEDLTQEELEALIALGNIPEELSENARDRDLQDVLRYSPGPEGRMAGNVYIAASPLEHMANAIQRFKAAKETKSLKSERQGMLDQIKSGRSMFGNIMRGRGQLSPVGTPGINPAAPPPMSAGGPFPMPSMPQVTPAQPGIGLPPQAPPSVAQAPTPGPAPAGPAPGMPPPGRTGPFPGGFPSVTPEMVQGLPQFQRGLRSVAPPSKEAVLAQILRARQGTNRGMMY